MNFSIIEIHQTSRMYEDIRVATSAETLRLWARAAVLLPPEVESAERFIHFLESVCAAAGLFSCVC